MNFCELNELAQAQIKILGGYSAGLGDDVEQKVANHNQKVDDALDAIAKCCELQRDAQHVAGKAVLGDEKLSSVLTQVQEINTNKTQTEIDALRQLCDLAIERESLLHEMLPLAEEFHNAKTENVPRVTAAVEKALEQAGYSDSWYRKLGANFQSRAVEGMIRTSPKVRLAEQEVTRAFGRKINIQTELNSIAQGLVDTPNQIMAHLQKHVEQAVKV